jgi:NADPH:quinone reductase-like Zn-dependent oxidoreductase
METEPSVVVVEEKKFKQQQQQQDKQAEEEKQKWRDMKKREMDKFKETKEQYRKEARYEEIKKLRVELRHKLKGWKLQRWQSKILMKNKQQQTQQALMKAVVIRRHGGPELLDCVDWPVPRINYPDQILIKVIAAGVNPVDIRRCTGTFPGFLPSVLGQDISGVVVDVGDSAKKEFKAGDEVYAMLSLPGAGGYAEYAVVSGAAVAKKPRNISHVEAASLPLVAQTSWQSLVDKGQIGSSSRVLIHAGAGGVGSFAVQLAKNFGAYVAATVSNEADVAFVKGLGADQVVLCKNVPFENIWKREFDVVLDTIGGDVTNRSYKVLKQNGQLICLVFGTDIIWQFITSRLVGPVYHPFVANYRRGDILEKVSQLVEQMKIKPIIDQVFPLQEAAEAHRHLIGHRGRHGKTVITVSKEPAKLYQEIVKPPTAESKGAKVDKEEEEPKRKETPVPVQEIQRPQQRAEVKEDEEDEEEEEDEGRVIMV